MPLSLATGFARIAAACLLAGLVTAAPARAENWREARSMDGLVAALERELDARTDWPRRAALPAVRLRAPQELLAMRGEAHRASDGPLRGLYDMEEGVIYLARPWNPRDAANISVLLHELAHHRQAPLHWVYRGAMEEAAYRVQADWAEAEGAGIDIDWFSVIWAGGCTRRDMHPD